MNNLHFYEKVVETIAVGEEFQSDLKSALKEAFENPRSFYDEDDEYILEWRGMTFSKDGHLTAKFVLVDKMIQANQMAETDWKEDEGEIRSAINKILKAKNYDFRLSDEIKYEYEDTFKILNSINVEELKPNEYCLEILDIDSDSYVFTIVPIAVKNAVAEMFEKLK